jgi:hypothetical protein
MKKPLSSAAVPGIGRDYRRLKAARARGPAIIFGDRMNF